MRMGSVVLAFTLIASNSIITIQANNLQEQQTAVTQPKAVGTKNMSALHTTYLGLIALLLLLLWDDNATIHLELENLRKINVAQTNLHCALAQLHITNSQEIAHIKQQSTQAVNRIADTLEMMNNNMRVMHQNMVLLRNQQLLLNLPLINNRLPENKHYYN